MRRRHLAGVLDIERRVYPRPWTPALFAAELRHSDARRYLVALDRGGPLGWLRPRVVGYAGILVQVGEAHVTNVAVDPSQHRRKIASRLFLALMRGAHDLGAHSATLEVRTQNTGASKLYQHFGFVPVGIRPGYYAETGEDAVIMWLHDVGEPAYAERLVQIEDELDRPGGSSGLPDYRVPWVTDRTGIPGQPATEPEGVRGVTPSDDKD